MSTKILAILFVLFQCIFLYNIYIYDKMSIQLIDKVKHLSNEEQIATPKEPITSDTKEPLHICDGKDVKWKVPNGISSIKVKIYEPTGSLKDSYTISNWITINSGETVNLIAE